jgi:hypothetical protein
MKFLFTSNDFKQYQQNICLQLTHIICAQPAIHSNGKRHRGQRFIFESGSISYGVLLILKKIIYIYNLYFR